MALNLFIKIGDILGESTDKNHKDEISVLSWSWGVAQEGLAFVGGSGAGKPTFSNLTFTHRVDRASPNLFKACATGKHLKDAKLTVRKAGTAPQEFLIISMSEVVVTQVTPASTTADASLIESVSLQFGKVDMEYKPQRADGTLDPGVHFTYDIQANQVI
jgi:type VI secretion system secreted protein Hcp